MRLRSSARARKQYIVDGTLLPCWSWAELITSADPAPAELRAALDAINHAGGTH